MDCAAMVSTAFALLAPALAGFFQPVGLAPGLDPSSVRQPPVLVGATRVQLAETTADSPASTWALLAVSGALFGAAALRSPRRSAASHQSRSAFATASGIPLVRRTAPPAMLSAGAGKKELVIWDCDGCLVDSEALLKTAEVEALHAAGFPDVTPDDCNRLFSGYAPEAGAARFEEEYGVPLPENFFKDQIANSV